VDGSIDTAHLGDLQVTSAKLAASAVIAGKIATGGVSATAQLADDVVDDTKVGNRVMKLTRRQGGNASAWATAGSTNYTPTGVLMQVGREWSSASADVTVTYPTPFSNTPLIFCQVEDPIVDMDHHYHIVFTSKITTGFTMGMYNELGARVNAQFSWMAIGPE